MAIATRWHKPSCKTPQVAVDGNVPACQTCGSSAETLLQRATKDPAPSYSGIKLPPEAPIGQMNLWWPPCVPYTGTRNGAPRAQPGASSRDAASVAPQELDSSLSEMYRSTLGKDRFRLLYLSGARTIGSPIHGDLVEYQRENCPEYETTSYSWGGEDGDATPCKPTYFGDFWDVLFLTRNCWSLLQYLRPRTGTRAVWVDAICINQNNVEERGAQVFHMPQIYRNCMRVVIYPGDHLVRVEEDKFRQRIRHDEIMKDGHVDPVEDSRLDIWGSVLQSRYISRVWIIQELILAPHAILALKHHDLDLSNNLLYCVSQKDNRRKWLEFMGQDYKLRQTTLLEGLSKTYDSQATDPRDRIFGILGILWGNATYSEIVPDYSISMRDCVIGAMGLTLIKSKEIWPLLALHGQNSKSTSGYPSWVPN
ncbi:heterokaryon incompatibility protein-domain-containing protein, partial [Diaporthe sp. PMI_573]